MSKARGTLGAIRKTKTEVSATDDSSARKNLVPGEELGNKIKEKTKDKKRKKISNFVLR